MRHSGIESSTRSTLCAMQPQAAFQEAKKPKYAASERLSTGHKRPGEAVKLPAIRSEKHKAARAARHCAQASTPRQAGHLRLDTMPLGHAQEPGGPREVPRHPSKNQARAADPAPLAVQKRSVRLQFCCQTCPTRTGRFRSPHPNPADLSAANSGAVPKHL